jgi:protein required for attachment to host cells
MAAELEKSAYDRLIIVAAPVTLGDLRAALSQKVVAHVVTEVAKDLTKLPIDEVSRHLESVLSSLPRNGG